MRFIRFLIAVAISLGIILAGYMFIWDFVAAKNVEAIKQTLADTDKVEFDYKNVVISGYPNNIHITVEDLKFKGKNENSEMNYKVGDVEFDIYPFLMQQQAKISIPTSQMFKLNYNNEVKTFKLQAQLVDFKYLEDEINLDLTKVKLFDVDENKLLLQADKFYYKTNLSYDNDFQINFKNVKVNDVEVDSILLDASLINVSQLDAFSSIVNLLSLEGEQFNEYLKQRLEILNKSDAKIDVKNMKFVGDNNWFELINIINIDPRNRVHGPVDLIASDIKTAEGILSLLTGSKNLKLEDLDILKRLISKSNDEFIRLSGKLERGYLYLFNEKVTRLKPLVK